MLANNDIDKLLISKATDTLRIAENRYTPKTFGFLNPRERMVISQQIKPSMGMVSVFDGGYPDAERTMFVCYPEYCETDSSDYIALLEISGRDISKLSHRDYLGSLMGLGLTRENIGDILLLEDKTLVFVKKEIADYIIANISKIGNCGINITCVEVGEIEIPARAVKEIKGTVSALRLDSVVSVAIGVSRTKVADMIRAGIVTLNWETVQDVSASVSEGDMLSVRGYGRMELSEIGCMTRKNRYSIMVSRYI